MSARTRNKIGLRQQRRAQRTRMRKAVKVLSQQVFVTGFGYTNRTGESRTMSDGKTYHQTCGFLGTLWVTSDRFMEIVQ